MATQALTELETHLAKDRVGHVQRSVLDDLGTHLLWARQRILSAQTPAVHAAYQSLYSALQSADEVIRKIKN